MIMDLIHSCRNAVDLTIEQTINRSAKTAGDIIRISCNASAYYRWCRTRHKCATYVDATLDRVDMLSDSSDKHKSVTPSSIHHSE